MPMILVTKLFSYKSFILKYHICLTTNREEVLKYKQKKVLGRKKMELREKFGFGCMRLPMKDKEVDLEQVNQMVD